MNETTTKLVDETPPTLKRIIVLFGKIADEYRAVADLLYKPCGLEMYKAAAVAQVIEDIADTGRLALRNLLAGRVAQADRRVSEAEAAYKDMPRLIERAGQRESEIVTGLSFVERALAGRFVA